MKNFLKRFCTIVMVFAMVLTMMPAGSIAYAFDGESDAAVEEGISTETGSAEENNIGEEQASSEEIVSAEEEPIGTVTDEVSDDVEIFNESEQTAAVEENDAGEPEAVEEEAPEETEPAADEATIPANAKFMVRVSSQPHTHRGLRSVTLPASCITTLTQCSPSEMVWYIGTT